MNITPKSIICVNGYKYGYKYALHSVLTECYEHNKNIFLVTFDRNKLNNDILTWQVFNNKYLNTLQVDMCEDLLCCFNHITSQPKFKKINLTIFVESYFNSDSTNMGVTTIKNFTINNAPYAYERYANFIKNNKYSIIFINNFDYDPKITNFIKENVTRFIDCEIHNNILGVKEGNSILYYEYKKLKGGYKVIGNRILDNDEQQKQIKY